MHVRTRQRLAVIAVNDASGTRRGTQTDDRGRYDIPFLDPGVYTIRATHIGYRLASEAECAAHSARW